MSMVGGALKNNHDPVFVLAADAFQSLRTAMDAINRRHFKLFDLPAHQRIFLFILTRSIKTYSSIRLLCEQGFGQDAATLLRSLLENLVTAEYILYDPDQADKHARRFVAYKWIILRRHLQEEEQRLDILGKAAMDDFIARKTVIIQKADEFIKEFKVSSDRALVTWSGRTVRDMAKAARKELLEEYDRTFRMCSRFSHPGILGDHEYIVQDGKNLIFSPNPSDIGINSNLTRAVRYAAAFLALTGRLFDLNDRNAAVLLTERCDILLAEAAAASPESSNVPSHSHSIRKSTVLFKV